MKKPNFPAMLPAVAEVIEQMMAEQGDEFSLERINLAELERRTGISRARLRRMKEHDFESTEHASKARSKHDPPERLYGHPGRPAESRSDKLCRVPEQAPCKRVCRKPDHD